jgi:hypothetical protein
MGFTDLMIFSPDMFKYGFEGVKASGCFENDYRIDNGDIQWNE